MFIEKVKEFYPEMKAIREDLHRHPELSYQEVRTSAIVIEKLKEYGVDEVEQVWNTGVVALIKGNRGEGKCIAIRADLDALPVTEDTGLEYSSENPGVMHACGHDLHVTTLLAAAKLLCDNRDFAGCVKLIFQPAEEAANPKDPTGGAMHMVEHGCLENPKVDAIIGLHVNPSYDKPGAFGLRKGIITSGFDIYRFDIHGKTAHGSMPHTGNDAVLAASQLIVMLQQVVSRNVDPLKTAILTVGTINGGTAINVIPDYVYAGGVFRYYDNDTAQVIKEHTFDVAKGVESISGCKIEVTALPGYRCVDNDSDMVDLCEAALKEELGEDACFFMDEPASGSEDFSYYSLCSGIPCSFMWLNTPPIVGTELSPLHSSKCAMVSDSIKSGAAGLASIAVKYLNK